MAGRLTFEQWFENHYQKLTWLRVTDAQAVDLTNLLKYHMRKAWMAGLVTYGLSVPSMTLGCSQDASPLTIGSVQLKDARLLKQRKSAQR